MGDGWRQSALIGLVVTLLESPSGAEPTVHDGAVESGGARPSSGFTQARSKRATSVYSRGNDDNREVDENGVSNFETARIAVSLVAVEGRNGETRLGLGYHGILRTDEKNAPGAAQNFKLVEIENGVSHDPTQEAKLQVETAQDESGRVVPGTKLGAKMFLGSIPEGTTDGTFKGKARVQMGPGLWKQEIDWSVTLRNGEVAGVQVSLTERPTRERTSAEMLRLVGSDDASATLQSPFLEKRGKSRGRARVG